MEHSMRQIHNTRQIQDCYLSCNGKLELAGKVIDLFRFAVHFTMDIVVEKKLFSYVHRKRPVN